MDGSAIASVAVAAVGSGALSIAINGWLNRKKSAAEGRAEEVRGELQVVDGFERLIQRLETEIDRRGHVIERLETGNANLRQQLNERTEYDEFDTD